MATARTLALLLLMAAATRRRDPEAVAVSPSQPAGAGGRLALDVSDACARDAAVLAHYARQNATWALSMVEASARQLAPEVTATNSDVLTATGRCLDAASWQPGLSLPARYCIAAVRLLEGPPEGRRQRWGACVPAACSAADVAARLREEAAQRLGRPAKVRVRVHPADCTARVAQPWAPADYSFMEKMVFYGLVLVGFTIFDIFFSKKMGIKKDSAWLAFSLRCSWRSLTHVSSSRLASVDGVKALTMVSVMLCHQFAVMTRRTSTTTDIVEDEALVSVSSALAGGSFLVLSGLLQARAWLGHRAPCWGRPWALASLYLRRYLRLTPALAAVVWLQATLLRRLRAGPLLGHVLAEQADHCRASWWLSLLYLSNCLPAGEACVVLSGYLSAAMQLFWVSPLLLWPMLSWPRAARGLLAGLLLAPLVAAFCFPRVLSLAWDDHLSLEDPARDAPPSGVYAMVYTWASPYLVGLGLGWLLFDTEGRKIHLPTAAVRAAWLAAAGCALAAVWAAVGAAEGAGRPPPTLLLQPLCWALAVAWLVFACERGLAGRVQRLVSWRGFQRLSRQSLTAYLVHFIVLQCEAASAASLRATSYYDVFTVVHILLLFSALVLLPSAVLTLAFELPFTSLGRAWLRPERQPPYAAAPGV